jgi:peptidoglycan/LPS O-acetylase OafA/YrhL
MKVFDGGKRGGSQKLRSMDYLWGLLLGILAAVLSYHGASFFPKKGWWILYFLPLLIIVAIVFLFGGKSTIYITSCISSGFVIGYVLALWKREVRRGQ